jgi:hypothetical protein
MGAERLAKGRFCSAEDPSRHLFFKLGTDFRGVAGAEPSVPGRAGGGTPSKCLPGPTGPMFVSTALSPDARQKEVWAMPVESVPFGSRT